MRVLMVSKALVVGAYQRKAEEIARQGVALTVLAPPAWGDRRGQQQLEYEHTEGYTLLPAPTRFGGSYHLHYYPALDKQLSRIRPDLLHMDEEPYNLATWLGVRAAHRQGIPALFFSWQNIQRRYPYPFRRFEQDNYRRAAHALAGSEGAAAVLRAKGCRVPITVLPQFGVDPDLFSPAETQPRGGAFRVGYAGGLLPEKGIDILLRACACLRADWRLSLAGSGAYEADLGRLALEMGISDRVEFVGRLPSTQMPDFYRQLDAFVLPSQTTEGWMEQFGRVLIEAMSCGVPVVGSESGEIPNVIGDAGLLFAEGDVNELALQLQRLADERATRARLGQLGRRRVLGHYTMAKIAQETVTVYKAVLEAPQR